MNDTSRGDGSAIRVPGEPGGRFEGIDWAAALMNAGIVVALSETGCDEVRGVAVTTMATMIITAKLPDARTRATVCGLNDEPGPMSLALGPSSEGCRHVRSCGGIGPGSTNRRWYCRSPAPCPRELRLDSVGTMPEVSGPFESKSDLDWLLLTERALPIGDAYAWAVRPDCGAVVLFSGTVRDHAEGRAGVEHLTYEAYDDQVLPRLADICGEVRRRWSDTGRIVLWHRTGRLELGESSVVTVVSAPHRGQAFEAGRFAIDALKESAPIWKHEVWSDGAGWGTGAYEVMQARDVTGARDVIETRRISGTDEMPAPT